MIEIEVAVVLVRPIYESNVGATSRAMDNMGFSRLILIDQKCQITYAAQQTAASGQDALQYRTEHAGWDQFLKKEPDGIRLAFSAKDGKMRPAWDVVEILNWLKTEHPLLSENSKAQKVPVYLIFGPEDWGLSNSDLELAHYALKLPTYGQNSSLNLAQAALLAMYNLRQAWSGAQNLRFAGNVEAKVAAKAPEIETHTRQVFPEQTLKTWLETMGFRITSKKINVYTVLKRLLLHQVPTPKELRVLETALQQSIRKMKK